MNDARCTNEVVFGLNGAREESGSSSASDRCDEYRCVDCGAVTDLEDTEQRCGICWHVLRTGELPIWADGFRSYGPAYDRE